MSDLVESERSWSSQSQPHDDDGSSDGPEAVPEPEPVEPHNCVGIKAWDLAASNMSKFFVCNATILKGTFRMDYRFNISTRLRDQKRFHPFCAAGIPVVSRARDLRVLRRWLEDPTLQIEAQPVVRVTIGLLQ